MTAPVDQIVQKHQLREAMLAKLRALNPNDRLARSAEICARVLETRMWQEAKTVALFSPLRGEPEISFLHNDAQKRAQDIVIISALLRQESDLRLSRMPDLILVPGLAFSRDRHRLGRGSGFFDRLLADRAASAYKLGVCFSFQFLEAIPTEPHDVLMDQVMTDVNDSAVF